MFIAETVTSAIVGYILVALFVSLLFFRNIWKNGEGREDIEVGCYREVFYSVQEQKHSCMVGCILLGVVWPVSVSIYLVCRGLELIVQGMLYISDKFVGSKAKRVK
jgi:uncharacterized membrane protein